MKRLLEMLRGAALLAAALILVSCRAPEELDKRVSVKLDPKMSKAEMRLIRSDMQALFAYEYRSSKGGWHEKIFGGRGPLDAIGYTDLRINYVLPESVDVEKRFSAGRTVGLHDEDSPTTVAMNIGTAAWLIGKATGRKVRFRIGNRKIPVKSTRVGIIQLGEGYLWEKYGDVTIQPVYRISTLIHEARHSDCTGGLRLDDLYRLRLGMDPKSKGCGHMHVECPAGHDLEGALACDAHAWGAYSVEAVFAKEVFSRCKNCSEAERQMALAVAADSFSRVTVLTDMITGRLGDPDMSSSDEVTAGEIRRAVAELKKARGKQPAGDDGVVIEFE